MSVVFRGIDKKPSAGQVPSEVDHPTKFKAQVYV